MEGEIKKLFLCQYTLLISMGSNKDRKHVFYLFIYFWKRVEVHLCFKCEKNHPVRARDELCNIYTSSIHLLL